MPVRIHLQFVKPSMRLARPVCDADGMPLAGAGTQLSERVVRALRRMALQTVLVMDSDGVESWEQSKPLALELAELEQRLPAAGVSGPLAKVRAAIIRFLTARAARLGTESTEDPRDGSAGAAEGAS